MSALLIEGESLVNDGMAAVFFTIALIMILGTAPTTASLVVDAVYAFALNSILIQGLTITPPLKWLGLGDRGALVRATRT